MCMNYIPYVLTTEFLVGYDTSVYNPKNLELCFMDKRKFKKEKAVNCILEQFPVSAHETITTSKVEIKNSGFTLELQKDDYSLIVHHPDFPETNYSVIFGINSDNYFLLFQLLREVGEVRNRKLIGTYYFNPSTGFFCLENKLDKEFQEKVKIGKLLSGSWEKLVPGHKYYIEIGPKNLRLEKVIYLGSIKNTVIKDHCFNNTYTTYYLNLGFDLEVSYYLAKPVKEIFLFKKLSDTEEDSYFVCNKSGLRGIDLGNTGETVSETEFYDMAIKNNWLIYIKDPVIFKKLYSEELIRIIDNSGPKFSNGFGSKCTTDLNKEPIDAVIKTIKSFGDGNNWNYTGAFTPLTRIISPKEFNLGNDYLRDILHLVYTHYGWKEN